MVDVGKSVEGDPLRRAHYRRLLLDDGNDRTIHGPLERPATVRRD
jgi:hypothetical protein